MEKTLFVAKIMEVNKQINMMSDAYAEGLKMVNRVLKMSCDSATTFKEFIADKVISTQMDLLRLLTNGGVKLQNGGVNSPSDSENGGVKMLEDALLEQIKSIPGLNAPALASTLNKSLRTTQRYLKQLTSDNKIVFRGAPKTGGYFINEK